MIKRVPTFLPTKSQREWLESEKEKTGESFSTILKALIQEKVSSKKQVRGD